jgi:uncharacterized Rmd1/YagE family protein
MSLPRLVNPARLTRLTRLSPTPHFSPAFSTATRRLHKHNAATQPTPTPPSKPPRKPHRKATATPSSLPNATAQASIAKSTLDPTTPTKLVTAYCAAETYDMDAAARLMAADGYTLDPFNMALFPQVIHVQTPSNSDIFVFPSGTLVAWDVPEADALRLVKTTLPAAAEGSHLDLIETEDLEYLEDASRESSKVAGDTIILGTKPPPSPPADDALATDPILTKIAFSSGLARSTKLAVLESLLATYQHSTRLIPATLSSTTHPPFTRSFILRKTGDLLSIRAQLNLYSELTDAMPDLFWDARHSLNLGGCYDALGRALDVGARIRVLNDKIGFAQEIAAVLREQLSEKHGLRLEWAIIALIAVEVVLECYRHWDERREREGEGSTEALLRRYLLRREEEDMAAKAGVVHDK